MTIQLPKLPYEMSALQPHISEETLQYHYGKHHKAYVDKLNSLIPGTMFEKMELEKIMLESDGAIFNNAAQVWNHTFYWNSLSPNGGGEPTGALLEAINNTFGSFSAFKDAFSKAATTHFASGWAWLTKDAQGKLEISSTANAGTPMTDGKTALLTCDVQEHAYYVDTRNDLAKYVGNFWELVNWDFVAKNLAGK